MQFFKYWVRSESIPTGDPQVPDIRCFGYSNESLEDARAVAEQRASKAIERLKSSRRAMDDYDYAGGPLREPLIEELTCDGRVAAVLTRVHYGAVVLNTTNVLFADVDQPAVSAVAGFFSMFSSKKNKSVDPVMERVEEVCRNIPGLGIKVYRTAAGYRCVVTSRTIEVDDPIATQILESLKSDALYVRLCKKQHCFRARLTPKPWRMNYPRPPFRFPFRSEDEKAKVDQWINGYESQSNSYATCELHGQAGTTHLDPNVASILAVHDHFALSDGKSLA